MFQDVLRVEMSDVRNQHYIKPSFDPQFQKLLVSIEELNCPEHGFRYMTFEQWFMSNTALSTI